MSEPFLCSNGDCKPVPFMDWTNNVEGLPGCRPAIVCPLYKPYLCADGRCVGD